MLALPAYHVAGLQVLVRSIVAGGSVVALPASFTPTDLVAAVARMGRGRRYTSLVANQLDKALADPAATAALAELDDPESLVVPILIDAILLVESYRGTRHPMPFVDELSGSVDALLREMTIVEKSRLWAAE